MIQPCQSGSVRGRPVLLSPWRALNWYAIRREDARIRHRRAHDGPLWDAA